MLLDDFSFPVQSVLSMVLACQKVARLLSTTSFAGCQGAARCLSNGVQSTVGGSKRSGLLLCVLVFVNC